MHYDVVIIGAGMSGLAAGIRLAMFDQRVCIVEKHYAYGGLNSHYLLNGRRFDVGLHALTNYVGPEIRSGPLPKIMRQLRLSREEFDLCEQRGSAIRFPGRTLHFTNDLRVLTDEVVQEFPLEADRFVRFLERIRLVDYGSLEPLPNSARDVLRDSFRDPLLIEMLLCPVMYYGSPRAEDMEFIDFVTIFRSIYCEGFARPREGILGLLKPLVKKYRASGGKLLMQCGVERIKLRGNRVESLTLSTGEALTTDIVISSAGWEETMRLCSDPQAVASSTEIVGDARRLTFVESFLVLDKPAPELGLRQAVTFFNDDDAFSYAPPDEPVDLRSGVVCSPDNYEGHGREGEGLFRLTWLANYNRWVSLEPDDYAALKQHYMKHVLEQAARSMPSVAEHVVFTDMFTPKTIEHFTGHVGGAVYGSPHKCRDGRTPIENLFICGTDQGFVGIIGTLMSGITMANVHVLAQT